MSNKRPGSPGIFIDFFIFFIFLSHLHWFLITIFFLENKKMQLNQSAAYCKKTHTIKTWISTSFIVTIIISHNTGRVKDFVRK